MGWGVKFRQVGSWAQRVFVQGATRAHRDNPVSPAFPPTLGEAVCKDSLIVKRLFKNDGLFRVPGARVCLLFSLSPLEALRMCGGGFGISRSRGSQTLLKGRVGSPTAGVSKRLVLSVAEF